ncbi:MAG: hypothetical protein Q9197_002522 [Variospora fuerteventurae]
MAPQRNLTLTEELEKLEQSITLTLQEIDHNFSRAHRIVTTSILPVVENYAEQSTKVWESSKFWKQFFEASANVSLSGYEEPPEHEETVTEDATVTTPSTPASDFTSQPYANTDETMTPNTNQQPPADESYLSTTPQEESTPRPKSKHHHGQGPSMALYSSPYETLKREIKGTPQPPARDDDSTLPSTPRNPFQSYPDSSPFQAPSTTHPHRTPKDDPLLHRILDKNWRLQATPHTTTRAPKPGTFTLPYRTGRTPARRNNDLSDEPATPAEGKGKKPTANAMDNDDLDSSPAVPAPQLHSEIFGTPARRTKVPGVSVLTPARGKRTPSQKLRARTPGEGNEGTKNIWNSDSDDEEDGPGMSPPKTIQFHVPQSRLLRTPVRLTKNGGKPAREASKKIVEDLLLTAGGNVTDEFEEESSPSVVRRGVMEEDDTF